MYSSNFLKANPDWCKPECFKVENIAYTKVVKVIWSDATDNWNDNGNYIEASYYESIDGTNYEFWNFSITIGSAGISQFYIRVIHSSS